jgi:hypothetical protein
MLKFKGEATEIVEHELYLDGWSVKPHGTTEDLNEYGFHFMGSVGSYEVLFTISESTLEFMLDDVKRIRKEYGD